MVNTAIIDFLKKSESEVELGVKLKAVTRGQELISLVKESGFEFTEEQFLETVHLLRKAIAVQEKKQKGEELSVEELEMVAGGLPGHPLINDLDSIYTHTGKP